LEEILRTYHKTFDSSNLEGREYELVEQLRLANMAHDAGSDLRLVERLEELRRPVRAAFEAYCAREQAKSHLARPELATLAKPPIEIASPQFLSTPRQRAPHYSDEIALPAIFITPATPEPEMTFDHINNTPSRTQGDQNQSSENPNLASPSGITMTAAQPTSTASPNQQGKSSLKEKDLPRFHGNPEDDVDAWIMQISAAPNGWTSSLWFGQSASRLSSTRA